MVNATVIKEGAKMTGGNEGLLLNVEMENGNYSELIILINTADHNSTNESLSASAGDQLKMGNGSENTTAASSGTKNMTEADWTVGADEKKREESMSMVSTASTIPVKVVTTTSIPLMLSSMPSEQMTTRSSLQTTMTPMQPEMVTTSSAQTGVTLPEHSMEQNPSTPRPGLQLGKEKAVTEAETVSPAGPEHTASPVVVQEVGENKASEAAPASDTPLQSEQSATTSTTMITPVFTTPTTDKPEQIIQVAICLQ